MKQLLLALALALGITTAGYAAQCENPESILTDALKESPDRLVTVLEDQRLAEFLANLTRSGYLTGSLPYVQKIYVVSAKMLPGHDTPHVWLFFVQDQCIIFKTAAIRKVIEENLPQ